MSVPTENIWCRWDVVFSKMKSIGTTNLYVSWGGVLAAMWDLVKIEDFQTMTGVAWCDVEAGIMEPDEFNARAQRKSRAGKDAQSPDEMRARPSPRSKHTQSYKRNALSVDPMTCSRWVVTLFEKQFCKTFADKLEKGWDLKEMDTPLLEPLEPRKAMVELATEFYNLMIQKPVGGAATLIIKATETEKQSWALNSAEECQAFRQRQRAEKVLQRKKVLRGKRPSGDKYRKEGASVPVDGTDPGSDPAETGL